mmetsp:Transcript_13108/g.40368  ORF Transcript_13108/g.40368 Transcript_13108/m.40368 type:complete len:131 (+) Transcript_13108:382-774(+)
MRECQGKTVHTGEVDTERVLVVPEPGMADIAATEAAVMEAMAVVMGLMAAATAVEHMAVEHMAVTEVEWEDTEGTEVMVVATGAMEDTEEWEPWAACLVDTVSETASEQSRTFSATAMKWFMVYKTAFRA